MEEPGDGEHGARYSLKELDGRHMPVIANTSYGALASKPERMAWLKEAKQGNRAAAQRLLDATLKTGLAEQVDEAFPDAVLVPVQYAGEGNVLPQLLAQRLDHRFLKIGQRLPLICKREKGKAALGQIIF